MLKGRMGRRDRNLRLLEGALCSLAGFVVLAFLGVYLVARPLFWLALILFLVVAGVMLLLAIIFHFRRSRDQKQAADFLRRNALATPSTPTPTPAPGPVQVDWGEQLRALNWFQFEQIVELIYRKRGYTVTRRGGANPDGGIDLIIETSVTLDPNISTANDTNNANQGSLDRMRAVQCKHWKTRNVGVKEVREFLGAMTASGIRSGIFVGLGGYTGDARALADQNGIEILSESHLVQMLEAADGRYDPEIQAFLIDKRKFCPKCEREMVLRTAEKGPSPGSQFWGCSGFPKCRFTMPV